LAATDSSISDASLATIIIAIATVVYTIGTLLLWWTTRKSIEIFQKQFEEFRKATSADFIDRSIESQRHIWSVVISNDKVRSLIAEGLNIPEFVLVKDVVGSMLINNASRAYTQYECGNFAADELPSLKEDIADMFSLPFMKDVWISVRPYHSSSFVAFIENLLTEEPVASDEEGRRKFLRGVRS
jgi:hypothetical protein